MTDCPLPGHDTPQPLEGEDRPSNHVFCPTHGLIHKDILGQVQQAAAGPEVTSGPYEPPVPEMIGEDPGTAHCSVCKVPWYMHTDRAFVESPPMREGGPPLRTPRSVDLGDCVHLLLQELGRG